MAILHVAFVLLHVPPVMLMVSLVFLELLLLFLEVLFVLLDVRSALPDVIWSNIFVRVGCSSFLSLASSSLVEISQFLPYNQMWLYFFTPFVVVTMRVRHGEAHVWRMVMIWVSHFVNFVRVSGLIEDLIQCSKGDAEAKVHTKAFAKKLNVSVENDSCK